MACFSGGTHHGSLVTGFSPISADGRLRSGVASHAGRCIILFDPRLLGDENIDLSSATSSASVRPMIATDSTAGAAVSEAQARVPGGNGAGRQRWEPASETREVVSRGGFAFGTLG